MSTQLLLFCFSWLWIVYGLVILQIYCEHRDMVYYYRDIVLAAICGPFVHTYLHFNED